MSTTTPVMSQALPVAWKGSMPSFSLYISCKLLLSWDRRQMWPIGLHIKCSLWTPLQDPRGKHGPFMGLSNSSHLNGVVVSFLLFSAHTCGRCHGHAESQDIPAAGPHAFMLLGTAGYQGKVLVTMSWCNELYAAKLSRLNRGIVEKAEQHCMLHAMLYDMTNSGLLIMQSA